MPTLGNLAKVRLTVELNDASTTLFTTALRQQYLNDGQEEFADQTECLTRDSTITVSSGVTEYSLLTSTDYVRMAAQGVEYLFTSSNGQLTQLAGDDFPEWPIQVQNRQNPGWRGSTTAVKSPTAWYRRQDGGDLRIGLFEPPSVGSSETAVIKVPYVIQPVAMTSTTAYPFTVHSTVRTDLTLYHKALAHYAAHKLLPLIGDTQGAIAQLQLFQSYVDRYRGNKRPRGGQQVMYATNYLQRARRGVGDDLNRVPGWTWR